jgi:hypothetical protein
MAKSQICTLEKEIINSRDHHCSSNLEYESPGLLFHNSILKYVVPNADS